MEGGGRQGEAGLRARLCKVLTGQARQGRAGQHRVGLGWVIKEREERGRVRKVKGQGCVRR